MYALSIGVAHLIFLDGSSMKGNARARTSYTHMAQNRQLNYEYEINYYIIIIMSNNNNNYNNIQFIGFGYLTSFVYSF